MKRCKEDSGPGNVLFLDLGGESMCLLCKNSSITYLRLVHFPVYVLLKKHFI